MLYQLSHSRIWYLRSQRRSSALMPHPICTSTQICEYLQCGNYFSMLANGTNYGEWSGLTDSNRRPNACKALALTSCAKPGYERFLSDFSYSVLWKPHNPKLDSTIPLKTVQCIASTSRRTYLVVDSLRLNFSPLRSCWRPESDSNRRPADY